MYTLAEHRAVCINPTSTMSYLIKDVGNCIGVTRRSWSISSLGGSAYAAWDAVPSGEMHYTLPIDVPEGAICYGLNGQHGQPRTRYGHAWIATINLLGWSTDYVAKGTWQRAPMSLPRWTGDDHVQWTSWTPYGRLPVGKTQRQRNAAPAPAPVYTYKQDKKVYSSKMKVGTVNSASVWNVALALHNKKYFGTPTDDFTPALKTAVANYQRSQGWAGAQADGIPGPMTVARLGLTWVVG